MPELFHRKIERSAIGFLLAIIAAASVGGIVEIAPLFTIHETVEEAPDMRLYTPLELAGRNIYVRELPPAEAKALLDKATAKP